MSLSLAPFMGSLFIILREGFEAMLIAMLIFTYVREYGAQEKLKYVWSGIGVGIALSFAIAAGFANLAWLTHDHEELFEGVTMLVAAGVLGYVAFWCHGAAAHLEDSVKKAMATGTALALAGAVCLAILREGFEIVLFYAALYSSDIADSTSIIMGGLVGLLLLGGVYYGMDKAVSKFPTKKFFQVSKFLLIGLALYFAYGGVSELIEVLEH